MYLSKSQYCSAIQCPKKLWLGKKQPDVFDETLLNQSVFDTGNEVGNLAKSLFGEYMEVPYTDFTQMLTITGKYLSEHVPVICEASFSYEGLFCRVDILKNLGQNDVEVYEVKSSGKEVRDIYFHDISFQCYILHMLGYRIRRACLVHINTKYNRQGAIDLSQFFVFEDMTDQVKSSYKDIQKRIEFFDKYMKQTNEPLDDIGLHCYTPYPCGFYTHCTRNLPNPNFFDIAGAQYKMRFQLYHEGLVSFEDLKNCERLNQTQQRQIRFELQDSPPHIDRIVIKEFLAGLSYPLYFLDFETFSPAIPLYDNSRPYQRIVFQYSLHFIEQEGGKLQHTEFLAYPDADPRGMVADRLCQDIPSDACVLAYNMSFEKSVIKELAGLYPEMNGPLMKIHDRIQDLMIPFSKGWYYCRSMQGSYSIKAVLPSLFPDDPSLNYANLDGVHNGMEASQAFRQMIDMSEEECASTRENLLKYCYLDTYAMVKIWQYLNEITS